MDRKQQPFSGDRTSEVAVLVDTATDWGRRLIQGVTNYAMKHGPWHLWVEPRGRNETVRLPRGWQGDGVIAWINTQRLADELKDLQIPIVNISGIRHKLIWVCT